jgi:predicted DCC family thiol-disulfide oxidoreductase YuxK
MTVKPEHNLKHYNNTVVFDNNCNLCNRFARFLSKFDKKRKLHFAGQEQDFLKIFLKSSKSFQNSILYISSRNVYVKSTAVIKILYQLGGLWKTSLLLLIIPVKIRDFIYDRIAMKRYIWFGKSNCCSLPE